MSNNITICINYNANYLYFYGLSNVTIEKNEGNKNVGMCFFDFFGEDVALWANNFALSPPLKLAVWKDIGKSEQKPKILTDSDKILNVLDALASLNVCDSIGGFADTETVTYVFSSADSQEYGFTFSGNSLLYRNKLYAVKDADKLEKIKNAAAC